MISRLCRDEAVEKWRIRSYSELRCAAHATLKGRNKKCVSNFGGETSRKKMGNNTF
jgi:hypothetical protein